MRLNIANNIDKIREDFPITKQYNYLNNPAIGVVPKHVLEEVDAFSETQLAIPAYPDNNMTNGEIQEEARRGFAKLINADPTEISFHENTSIASNISAEMLGLKRGDNVIMTDLDYPTSLPWVRLARKNSAEVRWVRNKDGLIEPGDFEQAIDDNTKVISISFVSFANGFKHDLDEIGKLADENSIHLVVDATQGSGYLDLDVKRSKISLLFTGNFKWLMGGFGAAELYCKNDLLEKFESPHVGWHSVEAAARRGAETFRVDSYTNPKTSAQFEVGNPSYVSIHCLEESLKYAASIGWQNIREATFKLGDALFQGLEDIGVEITTPFERKHRSAIMFCHVTGVSGKMLYDALRKEKIVVVARPFGELDGVRIGPYFWNTEEEVESLVRTLKQFSK